MTADLKEQARLVREGGFTLAASFLDHAAELQAGAVWRRIEGMQAKVAAATDADNMKAAVALDSLGSDLALLKSDLIAFAIASANLKAKP